jgi:hypothetical protein
MAGSLTSDREKHYEVRDIDTLNNGLSRPTPRNTVLAFLQFVESLDGVGILRIELQRFGVVPDGLTDVAVLHVRLAQPSYRVLSARLSKGIVGPLLGAVSLAFSPCVGAAAGVQVAG